MPPPKSKAESQLQKEKLVNSYHELLNEFSSKELRNVGNYALGKLIGKGSFGKVYLATHKLTNGSKVVLKSSSREDPNLAREIHHHRQFHHPHIARLYEVIVTEKLVWLVLEYCPGDELYNHLLQNGPMPIEKTQKIFTQLVGAVAYVHSKSCVHRDLKLENILLDKHENVKLCDFGFTREYDGKASYLQTFCGTICYSAPEMLKGEKYAGEKVDVWSLGIILYALIAGELPWDDDDDQVTKSRILTEEPKYTDRFPDDAKSLINLLLSKRPLLRPTLSDVLAHPFLAEFAPQQQANLKLTRPPPFSTPLEKATLERMRSAGVNTEQVMQNVLAQRCDALAGWWTLLIEKEERKERRRERKRREKEAEAKNLRRLSAASSRLERISAALVEVDEEGHPEDPRSRGRRERRSLTSQQLNVPDLPKLPETAPSSDGLLTPPLPPPPPVEKDFPRPPRSTSRGRPVPPPKERRISKGSNYHLSASQPDLTRPQGILRRQGARRRQYPIISQLAQLKHWIIESTKRAKSPHPKAFSSSTRKFLSNHSSPPKKGDTPNKDAAVTPTSPNFPQNQQTPTAKRSSNASSLALSNASYPGARRTSSHTQRPLNTSSSHNRNSLSPSPLTPRNSYRRSSAGLRGRKSTSSSVSSIRTVHHAHSHSKTSSISSNSIDTVSTPTGPSAKALGRSPHSSIKILPATPTSMSVFPSNIRLVRGGPNNSLTSAFNEAAPALIPSPSSGPIFARRKRATFKGPTLSSTHMLSGAGPGTPSLMRSRASSVASGEIMMAGARKSQIIEEEEDEVLPDDTTEEVDCFSPTDERGPGFPESSSLDAKYANAIAAAATMDPANLRSGSERDGSPDSRQLLPAAEITELPSFSKIPSTEHDRSPLRPPRSSSLREAKNGSPGSLNASDSLDNIAETSPTLKKTSTATSS
ncbi:hypothetical protein TRV_02770 [Trichophyton verrucosum HKI 0517]|uniref:Protein kinase domain-containing protein n=1 Tax=Trichophyton verrucosum (strain HKI 0517) TaxID=663202 RepID=D4D6P3_TRIVH|nr:uncharacterized protein TRV_02770 [Trichophyton verrucosum HKI 0517]EFE42462.1 hypothetical protein TRV_02770 [Trichophyton verrucosum HKI 0517]